MLSHLLCHAPGKSLRMFEVQAVRFALVHSAEKLEKAVRVKAFAAELAYYNVSLAIKFATRIEPMMINPPNMPRKLKVSPRIMNEHTAVNIGCVH